MKDKIEIAYWAVSFMVLCVNSYFIYRSISAPIEAVNIGRKLNDEQEIEDRKRSLFLTLFAYRGMPLHFKFVEALNQIEILFHDQFQILAAWYKLYDSMQIEGEETEYHRRLWYDLRVVLLDEMAHHLNYASLKQLRIQKAYYPAGHANYNNLDYDLKLVALRFLENGDTLYRILIDQTNANIKKESEKAAQD